MKKRPLVYLTLIYIAGIFLASILSWKPLAWFGALLVIFLSWLLFNREKGKELGWLLLLAFLFLGGANYSYKNQLQGDLLHSLVLGQELELTGKVIGEPLRYPTRISFDLELLSKAKIRVNSKGEGHLPNFGFGDTLKIEGRLGMPAQARNPGEFNYRTYLWQRGLLAELDTKPEAVQIVMAKNFQWRKLLQRFKADFTGLLDSHMSPQAMAVSKALILGDKTALEAGVKSLFLTLGMMHLLAVSGLHVGFLLILANLVGAILKLKRRNAFILTVALLVVYAALTNFTPSVVRAALMAFVLLLGNLLGRERDFYTSIALAAFVLLLYNPFYLFYSGFQLSFLATWGLVYFIPLVNLLIPKKFPIRNAIAVPIAAQIAVLPFTAYYFNLISLVGLPANLLLVPIAGIIVIIGLLALFFSVALPVLAPLLLIPLGAAIDLLLKVFDPIGQLPWSSIIVKTPSILAIILYYLVLIGLREVLLNPGLRAGLATKRKQFLLGMLILALAMAGGKQLQPKPLEIVFLDVGQGDAIFMRTPRGTTMLLDGGGSPGWQETDFRVGREVVVPYLQRQGIKKVDLLISSHPDTDHMQGLEDVLKELTVNALLIPPRGIFGEEYNGLLELANFKNVQILEGIAGDYLELDHDIVLAVLNPPGTERHFQTAPDNNHSLLVRLSYGRASILLTGDLELEALEFLHHKGLIGEVTIFKAPHHGSKTGFYLPYLEEINPLGVVYSVGRNSYGHPGADLLSYWEKRGVPGYRTDQNGAIIIKTDGVKLSIKKFINESD
ncbi:MAG: DNA internalization-related competence protein ComEC/Rec2 [Bacillota bacterium]